MILVVATTIIIGKCFSHYSFFIDIYTYFTRIRVQTADFTYY